MDLVKNKSLPYESIFDNISDGIFIVKDDKLTFCNNVVLEWLGRTRDEVSNIDYLNVIAPEYRDLLLERRNLRAQGKIPTNKVFAELLHKNQKDRVSVDISIIAPDSGEWAGYVIGTLKNRTHERHVEKLLQMSQQTLEEIISSFPDIYYVTDEKGIVTKISPSVREIMGYEPEEVIGKPMSSFYADPSKREEIVTLVAAGKGKYVRVEAPLLHKNGRAMWFNTRARFLFDAHGKIVGLEGAARDATAEQQRQENLLMHQARHAQMGEMMSAIAHQWRQPLSVLNMIIYKIGDLYEKDEQLNRLTLKADNLIKSMSQTIDDFRNFFAPGSAPQPFDLGEAINGAVHLVSGLVEKYKIDLNVDLPSGIYVDGFSTEIGHIVMNLLNNAGEEFINRKIKDRKVSIKLYRSKEFAILDVVDNAGGIDPNVLPKIFDPYFTTKTTGTGIGLYMAKNIVERHMSGRIKALNVNDGATFNIEFPISKSSN